jgi:polyhydroxyalkanoate synthesis regulator phasin
MDYNYTELLGILEKIHTEPAFSNIKKYIYSNSGKFTPDEMDNFEKLIKARDAYFNPKFCNWVREIRAYYKDENGHEFSISYSDGRAQALCNEAKQQGIPLPDYLNRMFARQPNFIAWTLTASGGSNPMVSVEETHKPYIGRGIRRGIEQAEMEAHEAEINIDIPDLLNKMHSDMAELIREAAAGSRDEIEKLRHDINSIQERLNKSSPSTEKNIARVLGSSQYRYFLANAYKLKLPVVYSQIARGEYQVSVHVNNEQEEKRALDFIEEAERHETPHEVKLKKRSPGFDDILKILCMTYEKEAGIPCGLSRTGALSTLASNIADYAYENGIDWQELDIGSIDLFAKRGKIYTSEQASEAFDTLLASAEGKRIDKSLAEKMEEALENEQCTDEGVLNAIENYDAISYIISKYHPDDPELQEKLKGYIEELKLCNYYPNRLDAARDEAELFLRQYGGDYDGEVENIINKLEAKYK